MKSIILVQHCQSEHHVNDLTGGWTDTPLTEFGRRQAGLIADRLKRELAGVPCRLLSSDLMRAFQTAEIIGSAIGLEPVAVRALREGNSGEATGKTKEWARQNIAPKTEPLLDWRPFPGTETWREFHARVTRCMDELAKGDGRTLLIVTHGGTLGCIVTWWLRLDIERMPDAAPFVANPGSITVLKMSEYGKPVIDRLNDQAHFYAEGLARPLL